jgi:SAM-dependent methyltransferase
MTFADYFSETAADYARYRPQYPKPLLDFLSNLVADRQIAWDCATGNGQVAYELTDYFAKVYASDASERQINQARKRDRLHYFVSLAESTPLAVNSVDLITVAQAFHWFKAEAFYKEVKRVLKPQGIIALWGYGLFEVPEASNSFNTALEQFYNAVEPFWPLERQLIDTQYRAIAFPFTEIPAPNYTMTQTWTVEELIGYLNTWSSTQKYIQARGADRLSPITQAIVENCSSSAISVHFPLFFRIGRLSA